jgi:Na+:H+ antiporter, NhaC family
MSDQTNVMKNEQTPLPSLGSAIFVLGFLIVMMCISVLWLDIPIHVAIILSIVVACIVALKEGYTYSQLEEAIVYGGKIAYVAMIILMIIGAVMGTWIASGTVPAIIYYGLKIISPSAFLITACLICCITSLATGSSWTTGGTVGVALIGIGAGLGIDPAMTAGAIISGAAFGDKMSPLSDTTNLAPAIAEADLFDHIKSMVYTTTPALILALIFYGIIGAKNAGTVNLTEINTTLETIKANFSLNPIVFIPAILVFVMAIKKVPALPTLIIASLVAAAIAMLIQGQTITSITKVMDTGFVSKTGIASIDKLLTRGGIQNMMWTCSLGFIGVSYGGILEKTRILEVFLTGIQKAINTTGKLVASAVASVVVLNFATASQYMSIVIGGRMFVPAYKERNLLPQTLSRTLEDAGTVVSPLVPWGLCGVFFAGTLGVPTISYIPYAVLCWACPIIAIIYGFAGKFQWKTGEIPSKKVYVKDDGISL